MGMSDQEQSLRFKGMNLWQWVDIDHPVHCRGKGLRVGEAQLEECTWEENSESRRPAWVPAVSLLGEDEHPGETLATSVEERWRQQLECGDKKPGLI